MDPIKDEQSIKEEATETLESCMQQFVGRAANSCTLEEVDDYVYNKYVDLFEARTLAEREELGMIDPVFLDIRSYIRGSNIDIIFEDRRDTHGNSVTDFWDCPWIKLCLNSTY